MNSIKKGGLASLNKALILSVLLCITLGLNACEKKDQFEFDLKGKWEVIGNSGFERAQPGCIIVFDGEKSNLNSFSSNYSFYTSTSDSAHLGTYSATVYGKDPILLNMNIIDNDNIELLPEGKDSVKLKRISTSDTVMNWAEIYKTFLLNQEQEEYFSYKEYDYNVDARKFGICDMDNDGVPELLVQYSYYRPSDQLTSGEYDIFSFNKDHMFELIKNNAYKEDRYKRSINNEFPGLFVDGKGQSYYLYETGDELVRTNYENIGEGNNNSPELIAAYNSSVPIEMHDVDEAASYNWLESAQQENP